jgi:predicted nuclease of predicted toxin-antitoxin system
LRILLDENLDWRLERDLPGHNVQSVPRIGWAGITNGELIARAEGRFQVLITMDIALPHQLNIAQRNIAVIILRARSNRLTDTRPLMTRVSALIGTITPGKIEIVST